MLPLNFNIAKHFYLLMVQCVYLQRNKYEVFRIKNCIYIRLKSTHSCHPSLLLCLYSLSPHLYLLPKRSRLSALSKSCSFCKLKQIFIFPGSPLLQITQISLLFNSAVLTINNTQLYFAILTIYAYCIGLPWLYCKFLLQQKLLRLFWIPCNTWQSTSVLGFHKCAID